MNNKLFYADIVNGCEVTTSQLVDVLQQKGTISNLCLLNNYFDVFCHIISSLIVDVPVVLLDSDISVDEKRELINDIPAAEYEIYDKMSLINEQNYLQAITQSKNNWSLTLFTSGTTGLPKRVSHTYQSLTRNVRQANSNDAVWGFAYNPTHMAGLQVFFQALLNQNTIVKIFGMGKKEIVDSIIKYNISHISATPTYYRLLLPIEQQGTSVVRLTSGGERFDDVTLNKLKSAFPNAKVTNVYASTEAGTLLASDGDIFVIKPTIQQYFKITDNELLIHKSLLGKSDTIKLNDDWYHTNDLVEVVSEDPIRFKFVSRKNEMINVGGYKVNPNEVENALRSHDNISEALVYAKENKILGNIICCDVVLYKNCDLSESDVRLFLKNKLQEYKIPRIVKFVGEIKVTRTGKLTRKQ